MESGFSSNAVIRVPEKNKLFFFLMVEPQAKDAVLDSWRIFLGAFICAAELSASHLSLAAQLFIPPGQPIH